MYSNKNIGKVLGQLETEVMEIVWQSQEPVSVAEVLEIIQKRRKIAYTTVMTIMLRLTKKGVLVRDLSKTSYLYRPKLEKEKFVAKAVHNIFTTAVSTLGGEAVTHFVKEIQKLSPKRRQDLLKLIDTKDENKSA